MLSDTPFVPSHLRLCFFSLQNLETKVYQRVVALLYFFTLKKLLIYDLHYKNQTSRDWLMFAKVDRFCILYKVIYNRSAGVLVLPRLVFQQ